MDQLLVFAFIGWAMCIVGQLGFRRPGVPIFYFAPVWRANEYLYPIGALLWIVGSLGALVAVGTYFLRQP